MTQQPLEFVQSILDENVRKFASNIMKKIKPLRVILKGFT